MTRQLQRYYALLRGTTDQAVQQKLHSLIKPLEARLLQTAPAAESPGVLRPRPI